MDKIAAARTKFESPILPGEESAISQGLDRFVGKQKDILRLTQETGEIELYRPVAAEFEVRAVTQDTRKNLELLEEFGINIAKKQQEIKGKTIEGLIAIDEGALFKQTGIRDARAATEKVISDLRKGAADPSHLIKDYVSVEAFKGFVAKTFEASDADLFSVTLQYENAAGKRISVPLSDNREVLGLQQSINKVRSEQGLVPLGQHGTHNTMPAQLGGAVEMETFKQIGFTGNTVRYHYENGVLGRATSRATASRTSTGS